jgi:Tfp pilus assembly protein PilN
MKRVELDYLAPARTRAWPGVLLLLVSLAVAGELVMRYRDAQDALARLQVTGKLVSPERRPLPSMSKERLEAEVKGAESVVRQLALPWASLIQAIEQSATRDVAILQLQPEAETRSVRLTAEARSREAMFAYLRRLGAAPGLAEVHVLSHQVQRDDPQHPIQFSVQAALRSAR